MDPKENALHNTKINHEYFLASYKIWFNWFKFFYCILCGFFFYISSIFIRSQFLCEQNWSLKFHEKSKHQSQQTLGFSHPYIGYSRFQEFQNQRKYVMKGIFFCDPQKYVLPQVWSFSYYEPLDFYKSTDGYQYFIIFKNPEYNLFVQNSHYYAQVFLLWTLCSC